MSLYNTINVFVENELLTLVQTLAAFILFKVSFGLIQQG